MSEESTKTAVETLRALVAGITKFEGDWQHYYTPGQGIGKPVHVPWENYLEIVNAVPAIEAVCEELEVYQAIVSKIAMTCGITPQQVAVMVGEISDKRRAALNESEASE